MVCTSSIGPGATNMVTAAALAHVNRLPVLLIPGDVFASRRPDPVLQQVEDFGDALVSANDCFRPVSRYFDRITRPEQLLAALPQAMAVLTEPSACGPATLAFCQDVQAEAYDWPESFFSPRLWPVRRQPADPVEVDRLATMLTAAKAPLIIAGGGVLYARAEDALSAFARRTGVPVAETQAGKGALAWDHPQYLGSIGVTGSSAANAAAATADLIVGVGTRLQDFTTGSRALFANPDRILVQVNVAAFDAHKYGAEPVVGDAGAVLEVLSGALADWRAPAAWMAEVAGNVRAWNALADAAMEPTDAKLPSDAQVIGAVQRTMGEEAVVVCAAGGLPGELHKLWRVQAPDGYHVEYGYSCMGYEIAGGLGVKLAEPDREVVVMVGDGSYLMLNSEIATSVMMGLKLVIVLLDNHGFGCINRLQQETGGAPFNNLLRDTVHENRFDIDFVAHAASLGARAEKVAGIDALKAALQRARVSKSTCVVVIETDPEVSTGAGGAWWDVPIAEVSERAQVRAARAAYEAGVAQNRVGG
jgi:3D-(3,5/4)-trihydroxycyclohexane-1,2-dione acylhydrolase (decyclizing)